MANRVCNGVKDDGRRANCVFDVTVTGDEGFAQGYLARDPQSCHIGYTITHQWSSGFEVALSIDNRGIAPISSWILGWSFANGQTIANIWDATETQTGLSVMVKNLGFNADIPVGGSYTGVGFVGARTLCRNLPASVAP